MSDFDIHNPDEASFPKRWKSPWHVILLRPLVFGVLTLVVLLALWQAAVTAGEAGVDAGIHPLIIIPVLCLLVLLFIRYYWRFLRHIVDFMPFCITLHEDSFQLGGGISRYRLPYDEIESVSPKVTNFGYGVSISCGRKMYFVPIRRKNIDACVASLREACSNAICIDLEEREHLPEKPANPQRALTTSIKYHKNKMRGYGFLVFFFGVFVVLHIWNILVPVNFRIGNFGFSEKIGTILICGVISLLYLYVFLKERRHITLLRENLARLAAANVQAERSPSPAPSPPSPAS